MSPTTYLICCYLPFVTQLSLLSSVVWRFSVKLLLIFILYLIISYFTQFSPLLSKLNPSADHSVLFDIYPTLLLFYYSAILYSPLSRNNIVQTKTPIEIGSISIVFSAVWHIPDPIEETSHHYFVLIQY